ncbi:MAG: hypothetical protein GX162_04855 [Firmicutes bacterium]|nr:hypothetical protein [Bacillota bacterium]
MIHRRLLQVTTLILSLIIFVLPLQAASKVTIWAWANDEVIRQGQPF